MWEFGAKKVHIIRTAAAAAAAVQQQGKKRRLYLSHEKGRHTVNDPYSTVKYHVIKASKWVSFGQHRKAEREAKYNTNTDKKRYKISMQGARHNGIK